VREGALAQEVEVGGGARSERQHALAGAERAGAGDHAGVAGGALGGQHGGEAEGHVVVTAELDHHGQPAHDAVGIRVGVDRAGTRGAARDDRRGGVDAKGGGRREPAAGGDDLPVAGPLETGGGHRRIVGQVAAALDQAEAGAEVHDAGAADRLRQHLVAAQLVDHRRERGRRFLRRRRQRLDALAQRAVRRPDPIGQLGAQQPLGRRVEEIERDDLGLVAGEGVDQVRPAAPGLDQIGRRLPRPVVDADDHDARVGRPWPPQPEAGVHAGALRLVEPRHLDAGRPRDLERGDQHGSDAGREDRRAAPASSRGRHGAQLTSGRARDGPGEGSRSPGGRCK
jgi:hypothetical protein